MLRSAYTNDFKSTVALSCTKKYIKDRRKISFIKLLNYSPIFRKTLLSGNLVLDLAGFEFNAS